MSKQITLIPMLTEKTFAQSESRVYTFEVPTGVNKHTVAKAVAEQFDVKVTNVNITNVAGKAKRTISRGGRRVANGREAAAKKAYVTLADGSSLPFFAAIEEAEEQEQKVQDRVDKAAAKQAEKDTKPARRGLRRSTKAEETQ